MICKKAATAFILFFFLFSKSYSAIVLPGIIGDSMVLQRNLLIPIWGKADVRETVEISFCGQTASTVTDEKGNWKIWLGPFDANATPSNMIIAGSNIVELKNILIGEVWLCAGQSNMQWKLEQSTGAREAIATANYTNIRLFNVNRDVAFKRRKGKLASWQICSPATVREFSGIGYFFALELYQEMGIPIGVINSSYGGSQAEAWTPAEYLAVNDDLKPCIERDKVWEVEREQVRVEFEKQMKEWKELSKRSRAKGKIPPAQPPIPDALRDFRISASIYKNMIEPLIPFAIQGVLWYQGEANVERAEQYGVLLPTMIRSWRERWGQGDFPFAIVQLPNFRSKSIEPSDEAWSHLRDAQRKTFMQTPNTGLIVTIDLGDAEQIHPDNKLPVGKRLAYWAMAHVYGRPVTESGPIYLNTKFKKKKAIVYFSGTGDGLKACDGNALQEFAIAGLDKQWGWANATILGAGRVVVWSDKVKRPKAVRYAFNSNPANPNLSNHTCIPASPFRTDDWSGPTDGVR